MDGRQLWNGKQNLSLDRSEPRLLNRIEFINSFFLLYYAVLILESI